MIPGAEDWRRRLTGRNAFDRQAAEAAIRWTYRTCGLQEPDRILWARGPREAADALHFLSHPPRRQTRLGLALLASGGLLWCALALAMADPRVAEGPGNTLMVVAAVLGFYMARVSARYLPAPPSAIRASSRTGSIMAGAAVYLCMMAALIASQRLGLPSDPVARGVTVALITAAGALPGAVLLFRIRQAYGPLPRNLQEMSPGRSVVRRLSRGRPPRLARFRSGVRPEPSLLQAYESAYAEAFARPGEFFLTPDRPGRLGALGHDPLWTGSVRRTDPALFRPIPSHLDGIVDAEGASAPKRDPSDEAAAYSELAYRVDRLFPFRSIALAVAPPTSLVLDADGRPHAEGEPAIAWADGTEVYAWRGRVVDRDLLDGTIPLTVSRIVAERERDRRWVLIERYGLGRFLTECAAFNVQKDHCGALYRLEQPGEPIVAVRVVNGSPEPDGTFQEFWLRVPPTVRTAREAVAWTFGLSPDEYDPVAQS